MCACAMHLAYVMSRDEHVRFRVVAPILLILPRVATVSTVALVRPLLCSKIGSYFRGSGNEGDSEDYGRWQPRV